MESPGVTRSAGYPWPASPLRQSMLATTRACHPENAMAASVPWARLASVYHRQFHLVAFIDRCPRATDHWPLFSRPAPHAAGRQLGLFSGSIPPWFVLSNNLSTINARAIWLCFGAFLSPPAPCFLLHGALTTGHYSPASRSTRLHPAGPSGVRSCADPPPLATACHRLPNCERSNGPDLAERTLYFITMTRH